LILKDAPWSFTHGTERDYMGLGLVYYCITYMLRARVAVCLGSGGGFVPRILRQAQRDGGIGDVSRTILIDANKPSAGFGSPRYLDTNSFFRTSYPEIEIIVKTTKDAAEMFGAKRIQIDYLHIDADHTFDGSLFDYETYRKFMARDFVITMHDTRFSPGVAKTIEVIRRKEDIELIDLNNLAYGLAIIKPAGRAGAISHALAKAQAFAKHPLPHLTSKAQMLLSKVAGIFKGKA
jgi:pyruvate/2-oxoacid:ferredoxin oxidoreductase beta subunit